MQIVLHSPPTARSQSLLPPDYTNTIFYKSWGRFWYSELFIRISCGLPISATRHSADNMAIKTPDAMW